MRDPTVTQWRAEDLRSFVVRNPLWQKTSVLQQDGQGCQLLLKPLASYEAPGTGLQASAHLSTTMSTGIELDKHKQPSSPTALSNAELYKVGEVQASVATFRG
jgi:hypothetical protein